jgi:hypothetical protein
MFDRSERHIVRVGLHAFAYPDVPGIYPWKLTKKQKIDALVHSALASPPAKQQEFLRQACAGDSVLFEAAVSRLASLGHTVTSQQQISPNPSDADTQAADHQTMPGPYSTMVGKTVSHYRVLSRLGSGGMGVVYQAEDVKLGRRVAVKFLPGELATDAVAFERLQREARAASALEHSNICPIYEFGEHEGHQAMLATALVKSKISGSITESLRLLDALRAEAVHSDYVGYKLQSRLLRGEIEMNSGKTAIGHTTLQNLQHDAQNKGFALFARQAGGALQGKFSF